MVESRFSPRKACKDAPLKVGIIASARHAIREPFAGGLEAHTSQLASELRARGHEVTVFASADSDPALGVEPVCAEASKLDLSDAAQQDASMTSAAFMAEHHAYLDLMLRLADRDLDVLQNSSLHYLPVAMARTTGTPMVTTLHTPPTPWLESALAAGTEQAGGSSFVAVSSHTAQAWDHVIDDARVIPNAVDTDVWHPGTGRVEDRAVWMGRVVPEKGLHLALDAAHAAGVPVDVAGPLHDRAYFEREVRPRLRPDDRLLGHLASTELAEVVAHRSVCLVTPCWEEPFGLVVVEALACGTPIAGFARGALPELVGEDLGALAAPGDVAGLAAAITAARSRDRAHCAAEARRRWSVEVMVDAYEDAYRAC